MSKMFIFPQQLTTEELYGELLGKTKLEVIAIMNMLDKLMNLCKKLLDNPTTKNNKIIENQYNYFKELRELIKRWQVDFSSTFN